MYFASSLHPAGSDRTTATHQRMFVARTRDFRSFEPAEVYLDPGHDVIDVAFLQLGGSVQRFAADARTDDPARAVQFVRQESGSVRDDPCFTDVVDRIGAGVLRRGEGPAVFADRSATARGSSSTSSPSAGTSSSGPTTQPEAAGSTSRGPSCRPG